MIRGSQYRNFAYGKRFAADDEPTAPRQELCLAYITQCIRDTAVPPSVDEMRKHLGMASKGAVHKLLGVLEARGKIRRMPHRARAIEVVGMSSPAYQRPIPVLDTSKGYRFFTVAKLSPEADAQLVEMPR